MSTTGGGNLNTDFDLMRAIAARTDSGNEEIRALLQSFIGRMAGVPPAVWGGNAATAFRGVVDRWNAESLKLHQALRDIADTIRFNENALREAGEGHARQIEALGADI
jgi:WXG100 family type VII secretion target